MTLQLYMGRTWVSRYLKVRISMVMSLNPCVSLPHPQGGGSLILQEILSHVGIVLPRSTRCKWGGAAKGWIDDCKI